jgi:hypothetical protein
MNLNDIDQWKRRTIRGRCRPKARASCTRKSITPTLASIAAPTSHRRRAPYAGRAGYPAIVLPAQPRPAYYAALDAAHIAGDLAAGDLAPFADIVAVCLREAFEQYWYALRLEP